MLLISSAIVVGLPALHIVSLEHQLGLGNDPFKLAYEQLFADVVFLKLLQQLLVMLAAHAAYFGTVKTRAAANYL